MISLLLGNWRLILGATMVVSAFLGGVEWSDRGWEAKVAESERQAEKVRVAKERKSNTIVTKEAKVEKHIVYRTKVIYKEIARTTGDAKCIDDTGLRFIAIWNKAATQANKPADSMQ